jgi:beta-phosphoglucomutase-like phosphatase (HAD superfamily)
MTTPVKALIFDMDGTMIDSMPAHTQSWLEFVRRHAIEVDVHDMMRRTTGRTGVEVMAELFQRALTPDEAVGHLHEKESIYRELFAPQFAEIPGFGRFAELAQARGLRIGVGTAGDRLNIAFAYTNLRMRREPDATVGGDEGLPGKPEPAIFVEVARRLQVDPAHCIVFEDAPLGIEAARRAGMRAVGICSSHSAEQLAGSHVLAHAPDFHTLITNRFLETHHVAVS